MRGAALAGLALLCLGATGGLSGCSEGEDEPEDGIAPELAAASDPPEPDEAPRLYDFVDDNPRVEFHPCDRTNDVRLISKLDKVVAIN